MEWLSRTLQRLRARARAFMRDRDFELLGYAEFPLNPRAAWLAGRDRSGSRLSREEWAELLGWREFLAPELARLVSREFLALPLSAEEQNLLDTERALREAHRAAFKERFEEQY